MNATIRQLYPDHSPQTIRRWAHDVASALGHGDVVWASRLQRAYPAYDYADFASSVHVYDPNPTSPNQP